MMAWLPVLGLIIGFGIYWLPVRLPSGIGPYLSVATIAGMDSIIGGIRAGLEGKFHDDVFISGFVANTLLAGLLTYLGDLIGVELYIAAVVVLGGRVFLNLSLIRRYLLTQTAMNKRRE
jgi:small basic protein